jgi:alanine racemase
VKYSIQHIREITGGTFLQLKRNDQIEYLLTDSRKMIFPASSLFFALTGPRRTGHQYIRELYDRGVRNFVIYEEFSPDQFPEANFILVSDTLHALQQLAGFHRQQFSIPVIGITGSNGKTILKEWLNQLLEDQFNIVRSPRSYNSQIGVPLSVWQIHESNQLGIFEAGISRKGEMKNLEAMIRPDIGIFTNIGEAHSEGFSAIGEKILEKLELFTGSRILIYNKDQDELDQVITAWRKKKDSSQGDPLPLFFTWGKHPEATLKILSLNKKTTSVALALEYRGSRFNLEVPFADKASTDNAMTCVCLLLHLEIPDNLIQEKLYRLLPVAMRLELKEAISRSAVINDSYNADLSSLKIALDFMTQQPQYAKRTVILSDILQSGKKEEDLYREVARLLREKKTSRLIGIGERISANREIFEQTLEAEWIFYHSTDEFIRNFHQTDFRDEIILLKGARVFEFERIDRLLARQVHQTVLEVSLSNMAHNLGQFRQLLSPSTRMMVMVKAFAYGLGSYEIGNFLQFHKVDYLGVAYADEGVALRQAGINIPIMVMNVEEEGFPSLLQYNLEPVIYSFRILEAVDHFFKKEGVAGIPVHIEIETGMNRLGFPVREMDALAARLRDSSFKIQSLFSHLAASEEPQQDAFTQSQARLLKEVADRIQEVVPYPFLRHISNTAAILRHPQLQLDMVRLGIGLYGIDSASTHRLDLKEAATLKSTISQIKLLEQGDTVGYNRRGLGSDRTTIATVRIGYADGYPRSLGNGMGKMWLRGHPVPTVGNICMDMTMVDISDVPYAREGDEIIVFGRELPVAQLAEWAGTIPYEIITGISQRVKRIYFEE